MRHPWLNDLTHESTLADLPTSSLSVGPFTLGGEVAAELDRHPDAPGVLVCSGDLFIGAISRRQFYYRLSKQFSREVYLHRPIRVFLDTGSSAVLTLDETTEIHQAAVAALDRPQELAYEPLVVRGAKRSTLLDAYTLLRAQAQLLSLAQSALIQNEKLAGLGQLAAGMAHEINNPLAFVSNNLAVLQRDSRHVAEVIRLYHGADALIGQHQPELAERIEQFAGDIDLGYTLPNLANLAARSREGVRRIQQIVADMRDFARMDIGDVTDADLNQDVTRTVSTLRGKATDAQVNIVLDLQPVPSVPCNPGKIGLVLLSLLNNAIEACDAGGLVRVRTGAEGEGLQIEISDTGRGIPEELLPRIFDPFFTTKPPGAGTGMGLSIAYSVVRDHGGTIDVDSTVGKGSTLRVTLPMVAAKRSRTAVPAARSNLTPVG